MGIFTSFLTRPLLYYRNRRPHHDHQWTTIVVAVVIIIISSSSSSIAGLILYIGADIAHRHMPKSECYCIGMESICLEINKGALKSLMSSISDSTFYRILKIWLISGFYITMIWFYRRYELLSRRSDVIKNWWYSWSREFDCISNL